MQTKSVKVSGPIEAIWQVLEETLDVWRYEIVKSSPHAHIAAKRGSKILGAVMGVDTKGGYRDLTVTVAPTPGAPGQFEVKFRFDFPSWTIGMPGAKDDCYQMVDEFAEKTKNPSAAAPTKTEMAQVCSKCSAGISAGAAFCSQCGEKVAPRKSAAACSGCGASLPTGAAFCTSCGAKTSA